MTGKAETGSIKPARHDDELCELFTGRLKIFQKRHGYRFSVDSILLGTFAAQRASGTIADLGTGSGILPVILFKHNDVEKIVGIEVQQELARLAQKNITYNAGEDKVTIIRADIRELRNTFQPGTFDMVISNPPFYPPKTGRINPDSQKAVSRHELHGTLADFTAVSSYLLKLSGRFVTIYPCSRIADLIDEMRKVAIEAKTLQFIHPTLKDPANLILVEGIKGAGKEAKVLPPLALYDSLGNYTEQVKELFAKV